MRTLLLFALLLIISSTQAQYDFLGKSRIDIVGYYTLEHEFNVKTKHVSDNRMVLTAKGDQAYPYYTYEIDANLDKCISVGIVSKDPESLLHFRGLLSSMGTVVENDEVTNSQVYHVENSNGSFVYRISTPYKNSEEYVSRRNIFYVLITNDERGVHALKK